MAELDPDGPGVLTLNIKCVECGAETPLSADIGKPPIPGKYELSGNCSDCGKELGFTAQVAQQG